jgi:serine/threonine-protein kinase RsbW
LTEAETLQSRLGVGRYVLWLLVGDSVSVDAWELLRARGLLCTTVMQLRMLDEILREGGRSEGSAAPQSESEAAPPRRTVIAVAPAADAPAGETSALRLPARDDSEYIAALMAEKIAYQAGFDPAQAGKIKTSVLEGALNAIEHSPNREKMIEIRFRVTREALEIRIENEGAGFDPLAVPDPDPLAKLTAGNKRGWGLKLMKRFMDEVDYEPCPGGTRLRLVKRRPAAAGGLSAGRGITQL